jgi:phytoene/squalene synthetase
VTRHEVTRECRRELTRAARRFGLIPELFPPPVRDDVSLLYCLCRRIDDAVDDGPEPSAELARWRDELSGNRPRPLAEAFLALMPRLPRASLESFLDGMESDLGVVRMADDAALLRYAYRVSSSVGLMLAPLIGWRDEATIVDLGLALQISNVILGVSGDARRGRVYLPATRLHAAGFTADDVLAGRNLRPVLRGLADLADRYYRGVASAPLRYRHGILLFTQLYRLMGRTAAWRG